MQATNVAKLCHLAVRRCTIVYTAACHICRLVWLCKLAGWIQCSCNRQQSKTSSFCGREDLGSCSTGVHPARFMPRFQGIVFNWYQIGCRPVCTAFLGMCCPKPLPTQLIRVSPPLLQVAIGLRSVSRGHIPDKAFIIVSLAVTAFMLIAWRTGLAVLTKVCLVTLCNIIVDNLQSHPTSVE